MKRAAAVFVVLIMLFCSAQAGETGKMKILCYGDSNTYGYDPNSKGGRYPEDIIWPALLQDMLGDGYEIINEGQNGRTTAFDRSDFTGRNGLTALPETLERNGKVDMIIIMLGTNDVSVQLGLSPDEIAEGLELLVKEAIRLTEADGTRIAIVVPGAVGENYANSAFAGQLDAGSYEKSRAIVPLFAEAAEKYGCLFADASESVEISDIDSEHLTEKGHEQMAEIICSLIISADTAVENTPD